MFNIFDIKLDSPETKVASKIVIKIKCTQNCIYHPFTRWCPPSGNHSMDNVLNAKSLLGP